MNGSFPILVLVALIATAVFLIARQSLHRDKPGRPGADPDEGNHVLTSDYSSGLGGHSTSWTVPKDPQAYARMFIPKDRTK